MEKKQEEQQFEIDEMAAMQVELLEQLKSSAAEVDTKTRAVSEQQAELESKDREIDTLSQNLDNTTNSLSATLSELTVAKDKLSSVLPKLDSADAELRLLRTRMRELDNVEMENSKLVVEIGVLQPMRTSLDAVAEELRSSSTFAPGSTKTGEKGGGVAQGTCAHTMSSPLPLPLPTPFRRSLQITHHQTQNSTRLGPQALTSLLSCLRSATGSSLFLTTFLFARCSPGISREYCQMRGQNEPLSAVFSQTLSCLRRMSAGRFRRGSRQLRTRRRNSACRSRRQGLHLLLCLTCGLFG